MGSRGYSRTTVRASGSSSTMTTRKRVSAASSGLPPPAASARPAMSALLLRRDQRRLGRRAARGAAPGRSPARPRRRGCAADRDRRDSPPRCAARRRCARPRRGSTPPSRTCAIPCVTAFSTSGCSSSGGTRHDRGIARRDVGAQALAEADPLDRQEPLDQRQLARERDPLLTPPSARLSRRKSASSRHIRRAAGGSAVVKRADRVQAVEQEVRIDLRAQRPQLGLAREHLDLQPAALRLLRGLEDGEQVADRERQQIQQHAEAEQQRAGWPRTRRPGPAHRSGATGTRPSRARWRPRSPTSRAAAVSAVATIAERAGAGERHAARDVPGREADERERHASGRAIADAKNQPRPRCPASTAARRPPTSSQSSR